MLCDLEALQLSAMAHFLGIDSALLRTEILVIILRHDAQVIVHHLRYVAELFDSLLIVLVRPNCLLHILQLHVTAHPDHLHWVHLLLD